MSKLENKIAVVTGGSRGIGRTIVEALLKEEAAVVALARKREELESLKNELNDPKLEVAVVDVSDQASVEAFVKDRTRIDILVNAAGIYGGIGSVDEVDPKEWLDGIMANLYGTFLMTRFVSPLMKKNNSGVIVNFVGGGEGSYPHFSSYVASKGGVARFTETAAEELAPAGIRVNAISPGLVNTKFTDDILAAGPEKAGQKAYDRAVKLKAEGGTSPEKAAALIVFLASDTSKEITGRILSAEWTPYEKLPAHATELAKTDVYQMRKIVPKDRGFDWEDRK